MRCLSILVVFLFLMPRGSFAQTVNDDFEGSGTISTWFGDDCGMDASFANPYQQGINTSAKVLKYQDTGGAFANVRFDIPGNFDFSTKNTFALKIYVPSSGLTGNQGNQALQGHAPMNAEREDDQQQQLKGISAQPMHPQRDA